MSHTSERGPQMASLIISGKVFPLYRGLNLIGRSRCATVILRNECISQQHAIITIIDRNQHFVSDVKSSNGTLLNKNKLEPLCIYELEQDNVIEFTKVVAIYKKEPVTVNGTATNTEVVDLQNTQDVDETFYSTNTQTYEDPTISPISIAHHNGYFDDGYDFNNLPSPPSVTIISPMKSAPSIHEMATQVFTVADVDNAANSSPSSTCKKPSISVYEMPTQRFVDINTELSSPPRIAQISSKKPALSVHEMPTQTFVDVTNAANEIEITTAKQVFSIHDLPTQLMFDDVASNVCVEENILVTEEVLTEPLDSVQPLVSPENSVNGTILETPSSKQDQQQLDVSEDLIDKTLNCSIVNAGNSKFPFQRKSSLSVIENTPYKKTATKSIFQNNASSDKQSNEVSQEIGQTKKTVKPLDTDSEEDTDVDLKNNESGRSQSQEIGFKKKVLRQIDSDSDTDIDLDHCDAVSSETTNKQSLKNSSPKLSVVKHSLTNPVVKSANKNDEISKIGSDSETDVELTQENGINNDGSGSETDIDSDMITDKNMGAKLCANSPLNKTGIDCGKTMDISENINESVDANTKINTSDNDASFIPATQFSDEDSNDFNFMTENVTRNNDTKVSTDTQGSVLDISQKLKELRKVNIPDQNYSIESINFKLSELEGTPNIEEQHITYDAAVPEVDKSEQEVLFTSGSKENVQRITDTVEPVVSQSKSNVSNPLTCSNENDPDNNIFEKATQEIENPEMHKSNSLSDDEIYLQPTQAIAHNFNTPNKKTSVENLLKTSTPHVNEDDLFLQPTQKIEVEKEDEHTFAKPTSVVKKTPCKERDSEDDDIFFQPTQRLPVHIANDLELENKDDDIFCQPTQPIHPNRVSYLEDPGLQDNVDEDHIFLQPTQANFAENMLISDKESIPTFGIINDVLPKTDVGLNVAETAHIEDEDSIYLQPTQPNFAEHNISPSHKASTSVTHNSKLLNTDVGVATHTSLSPLKNKVIEEDESQLEVTFASQSVRLCSQGSTRPQNPLVNMFEMLEEEVAEDNEGNKDSDSTRIGNIQNNTETSPIDDLNESTKNCTNAARVSQNSEVELHSSLNKSNTCTPNTKFRNITIRSQRCKDLQDQNNSTLGSDPEDLHVNKCNENVVEKKIHLKRKLIDSTPKTIKSKTSKRTIEHHLPTTSNNVIDIAQENSGYSVAQTSRTRRKHINLIEDNVEIPMTADNIQTRINTRNAKKLDTANAESVKAKKQKEPVETPKVNNNNRPRRGRKLNMDQQDDEDVPVVACNVKLRQIQPSSNELEPIVKKQRKQNIDVVILKATASARKMRKRAAAEDSNNEKSAKSKIQYIRDSSTESLEDLDTTSISTPSREKRLQKPKVVFTMLDDTDLAPIIRRLGGSVVDTVESCTVLITGSVKRSLKLLSAVGKSKPICGPDWIHASKRAGVFLEPWDHLLVDLEAEQKWKFSLRESLSRSNNKKLLENHTFRILTNKSVDVIKAAIESCGGKLVTRVPPKPADDFLIIGSPEERKKYLKYLQHKPPMKVINPEAVFDGVLRQELHWDDHLLS